MSSAHPACDPEYFEQLYEASDDPWGLEDRFYEQRKRNLVVGSLPRDRFGRAFEPGCATGLLTQRLAQRCHRVVAWDGSARAVDIARTRLTDSANVSIDQRRIPDEWPSGAFDLIVVSEVGYYCNNLEKLTRRVLDTLSSDGVLVACHWRHPAPDHAHGAETVHGSLGSRLQRLVAHVEDDFLLDVWARDPRSVARRSGILS